MNRQSRTLTAALTTVLLLAAVAHAAEAIDIGSRRELFVDQHLIERMDGVRLELHRPVRREVVFRSDAPWEGNGSAYQSVFQDGDRFRIYYRGGHHPNSKAYQANKNSWETLCLAESKDGIRSCPAITRRISLTPEHKRFLFNSSRTWYAPTTLFR